MNVVINDFCCRLSLLDAYRYMHPNSFNSYAWFKSDLSQKSRIDFWLISDLLAPSLYSSNISPAPLTDHAGTDLIPSNAKSSTKRIPGYWKLNSSFLLCPSCCSGIKEIVSNFQSRDDISSITKWKLLNIFHQIW